ncbi:molybdenum cofactor biosynthesis protein MoaE [Hellea sp.]|nr:molybdenum cofactor biosynthesis protein MoaE [Hellea sp.]
MGILRISTSELNPEIEHRSFRDEVNGVGAIVAFTGIVRGDDPELTLTLSHYAGFTEKQIIKIATNAEKRWSITNWRIIHRVGIMLPNQPIVFVATSSRHRRDSFESADFLMDYLKSEAPFWKSEKSSGQVRWIEPRVQDFKDKKRWEE